MEPTQTLEKMRYKKWSRLWDSNPRRLSSIAYKAIAIAAMRNRPEKEHT